jgi:hypothetical protein
MRGTSQGIQTYYHGFSVLSLETGRAKGGLALLRLRLGKIYNRVREDDCWGFA